MFNQKLKAEIASLQAELNQYKRASNNLKNDLLYWQLTPAGVVQSSGSKNESVLGSRSGRMAGEPFTANVADKDLKSKSFRYLSDAIKSQHHWTGSINLKAAETATSVQLIIQPHYTAQGVCDHIDVFGTRLEVDTQSSLSNEDILQALDRSMAIIEFEPGGIIIKANSLFLQTTGYSQDEIRGKHHRMFCPQVVSDAPDYQQTWDALARGKFISGRFERVDKHGNPVWLEASYNPVIDDDGQVYKVIKFASNVTQQVDNERRVKEAAEMASSMSAETGSQADRGQQLMTETVASLASLTEQMTKASTEISELEQQSSELNKMVSAISAIADQTNLLALNAAIEAARAGDQGRGFAVVADEVRELASRTTESTKEIMAVFSRNDQSTKHAVSTIKQGLETLDEVAQSVAETKTSMSEIASGSKQIISAVDKLSRR
ncbi:methyl-accepting chemotaxis protein [uncultured Alteromonas sp.]|jgi:methyl-accepting chemotaxis protein|uniref:methyl-accepting chemotaxis protein n=1 Tax=uncultured Alteromonas sp. TaxID=179113 RepID=UPI0025F656B5|nr:methyl-accepting chemotaxis protein [uncultured Alteromonas sp.]